jgi:hypothetical protein
MVGLHLDLRLELVRTQVAGHMDHLGDRGVAADRHGAFPAACASALHGAANGLADRLGVDDRFLVDGIRRRRLGGMDAAYEAGNESEKALALWMRRLGMAA